MNKARVAAYIALVFWLALAVAVADLVVTGNPSAQTGIFGTSLGGVLWSWVAWDLKRRDHQ